MTKAGDMKAYGQRIDALDGIITIKSDSQPQWMRVKQAASNAAQHVILQATKAEIVTSIGELQIEVNRLARMFNVTPEQAANIALDKLEERMRSL